jgi:hypothetical protein
MKVLALVLIVVGIALLPLSVLPVLVGGKSAGPQEAPPPVLPVGHDQARPGATIENGWSVSNIPPCTFLDVYTKAADVLGPPVSGFDGVNEWFEYGELVCIPGNPAGQQVVLANIGYFELRSTGQLPLSDSPLDPAVQDFVLSSLERGGIDPGIYFGEPISGPLCDKGGHCVQYLEKTRLEFPQGATSGEQVVRSPLGLWQSHPESRPSYLHAKLQAATRATVRLPLLIAGLCCLGLGVALLAQRRFAGGFASGATI